MTREVTLGSGVVLPCVLIIINHCPSLQWSSSAVGDVRVIPAWCVCAAFPELISQAVYCND